MITFFLRVFCPSRAPNHPSRPPLKGRSLLLALNRNDYRGIGLPSPFGEGPGGEEILLCAYFVVGHTVCFNLCLFPPCPPLKRSSPLTALNRNDYRGFSPPSPFGEGPGGEEILLCAYFVVGHTVCFTLCLFPPCPPLKRSCPLTALNRNDYRGIGLPSPFGEGPGGEGKTFFQMERGQGVRITVPSP